MCVCVCVCVCVNRGKEKMIGEFKKKKATSERDLYTEEFRLDLGSNWETLMAFNPGGAFRKMATDALWTMEEKHK